MNKKVIEKIFLRFYENNPDPVTELIYHNDFQLLVAVILSAQSTDKSVNKATYSLFKIVKEPKDMLNLGEQGLIFYIKSIGLYKNKAKNIIKCCEQLINVYNNEIPDTKEELQRLSGVGAKTANVVLNTLYNKPCIAVDTHVLRVANRIGFVNSNNPIKVEEQLTKIIPSKYLIHAHNWLVLHGRYICKSKKQICSKCIIVDLCDYKNKNI